MTIKGFPLACFKKPNFEENGVEFFVCNGGGGLAGAKKKNDPAHTIFVRDWDVAQNLNMQAARTECSGRFSLSSGSDGVVFQCDGKELNVRQGFKAASKSDWKRYETYLNK
jgi:hypothetical protein